jgi:hypothetical protein
MAELHAGCLQPNRLPLGVTSGKSSITKSLRLRRGGRLISCTLMSGCRLCYRGTTPRFTDRFRPFLDAAPAVRREAEED